MSNRATIYKSTIDMNNKTSPRVMAIDYMNIDSPCVLDVGCACGDLGISLREVKQAIVYGFEYNSESIKIAWKTNAYTEINQLNIDNLTEADFPQYKKKFDYVVCGDVLEHLRFPQDTLKILKTYLKNDGYLIASIPNVAHTSIKSNLLVNDFTYTPLGLLDETHIHLFTYKSIADALSKVGLKIEACNWTLQSKQAWQPNNPYPLLSEDIKKFLFEDWHSFVCQYVVKLYPTRDKAEELLSYNLQKLSINEENAPENIKKYRTQVLSELGELSEQKIAKLTTTLSQKEEAVSSLTSNIESLKKKLSEKEQMQKSLQEEISKQKSLIAQKEDSLKKQDKALTQLTAESDSLKQDLSAQETKQKALQEEISKQKSLIAQKEDSLKKQDEALTQLTIKCDKLQMKLSLKESKITKLEKKLIKKKKKYKAIIILFLLVILCLACWLLVLLK